MELFISKIGKDLFNLSDADGTSLALTSGMAIVRQLEVRGFDRQAALSSVNTCDEFGSAVISR